MFNKWNRRKCFESDKLSERLLIKEIETFFFNCIYYFKVFHDIKIVISVNRFALSLPQTLWICWNVNNTKKTLCRTDDLKVHWLKLPCYEKLMSEMPKFSSNATAEVGSLKKLVCNKGLCWRTSCQLDIRFFPYDQQNCTLIISSWTSSKSDINYEAEFSAVNLDNFIPNEEWVIVSFEIRRVEVNTIEVVFRTTSISELYL